MRCLLSRHVSAHDQTLQQRRFQCEYYQLAETRWDPTQRRPTAHIIHNFGRADTLDREALLRLAQSISRGVSGRYRYPARGEPPGEAIDIEWARPLGGVHVARALGRNWALARSCGAWSRVAPVVRPMSWRSSRWWRTASPSPCPSWRAASTGWRSGSTSRCRGADAGPPVLRAGFPRHPH